MLSSNFAFFPHECVVHILHRMLLILGPKGQTLSFDNRMFPLTPSSFVATSVATRWCAGDLLILK